MKNNILNFYFQSDNFVASHSCTMNTFCSHILSLFALSLFLSVNVAFAQNPKQTRKQERHMRMLGHHKSAIRMHYEPHVSDHDGDGVGDNNDHCPDTPIGQKVNKLGCPLDKDGDGVPDEEDACPEKSGIAQNHGCPWPDSDNDGIIDIKDDCPDQFGLHKFKGCPDSDKDGVPDKYDKCPDVIGVSWLQGCPPDK